VPSGVEGQPAQRTRRPTRCYDALRPGDERQGGLGGHPHPEGVGTGLGVVPDLGGALLTLALGGGLRLDHHDAGVDLEPKRKRRDAELLLDRLIERGDVLDLSRRAGGDVDAAPPDLVEQLGELLGQQCYLRLLQGDADGAPGPTGLQIESAVPGLADGARDEALGRVELMDLAGHATSL
jgi:hypothetical protein